MPLLLLSLQVRIEGVLRRCGSLHSGSPLGAEQKERRKPGLGLPPFATRQNSSLSRPGTMSMTRSSMGLGNAP